jgi:hypothetical protein
MGSSVGQFGRQQEGLAALVRVTDHGERQDQSNVNTGIGIVNAGIGIVNSRIGHREHVDRRGELARETAGRRLAPRLSQSPASGMTSS